MLEGEARDAMALTEAIVSNALEGVAVIALIIVSDG